MSLRKGSLEEYFNTPSVANSICGKPEEPGQPRTCYQDAVEPNTRAKLNLYINPEDAPKRA
jgi:hypothetical protein